MTEKGGEWVWLLNLPLVFFAVGIGRGLKMDEFGS
jgi:hypothetical protein